MNPSVCACCVSLLLLHLVGAKPVSELQTLKQLLEEEIQTPPSLSAEEMEVEDLNPQKAVFGAPDAQPWDSDHSNSAQVDKDSLLSRIFKDLVRTSKRSWSRYKKGGLRSCFGVRLQRIGSFSGLGC